MKKSLSTFLLRCIKNADLRSQFSELKSTAYHIPFVIRRHPIRSSIYCISITGFWILYYIFGYAYDTFHDKIEMLGAIIFGLLFCLFMASVGLTLGYKHEWILQKKGKAAEQGAAANP